MESNPQQIYQTMTVGNKVFIYRLIIESKSSCCLKAQKRKLSQTSMKLAWKFINERLEQLFANPPDFHGYEMVYYIHYVISVVVKTSKQSIYAMLNILRPTNVDVRKIAMALDIFVVFSLQCPWLFNNKLDQQLFGRVGEPMELPIPKNHAINLMDIPGKVILDSFSLFNARLTGIYYKHRFNDLTNEDGCQGVSYFTLANLVDHNVLDYMIKLLLEKFTSQVHVSRASEFYIRTVLVAYWVMFMLMHKYRLTLSETLVMIDTQDQYSAKYYDKCITYKN